MKKEILDFIKEKDGYVSFVELEKISGFSQKDGISLQIKDKNIMLWKDLSEKACDSLIKLLKTNKIYVAGIGLLYYLVDGKGLTLPIAKRINHKYKKTRWLPVVFSVTK